ncbi:hypothetical protein [Leptospira mtsangambouensis]|uniref:hypothetical protein n=1 Tax=Leptospira mtsangambouensis TaxID=2484912 RepID=UPI001EE9F870|nr:hypothetical protein [Leptospira mtsangambouensis]MCG6140653.1 hypothetical protein [Leptospira mtsangambouensis]
MKNYNLNIENARIQELAKEYLKKGYKVFIEPGEKDLPIFLKKLDYKPDLIVKSAKENLVIEVKSSKSLSKVEKLKNIPDLFKNKKKWEFLLVLTNPTNQDFENISFNEETIINSFNKIELLLNENNNDYFLDVISLYLWSVTESILRFGLSLNNYKSNSININSILRDSQIQGLISKRDFLILSEFQKIRNRINHGNLDTPINLDNFLTAFNVSKRILNEIRYDYLEQNNTSYIAFLKNLSESELKTEIENLISETIYDLINEDELSNLIASTNAFDWEIDNFSILNIKFNLNECIAKIKFHATGEQHEEKMFSGSEINGECTATIDSEKNTNFEVNKITKE